MAVTAVMARATSESFMVIISNSLAERLVRGLLDVPLSGYSPGVELRRMYTEIGISLWRTKSQWYGL